MISLLSESKLCNRLSLVADICEALRCGQNPAMQLKSAKNAFRGDADWQKLVLRIYQTLRISINPSL